MGGGQSRSVPWREMGGAWKKATKDKIEAGAVTEEEIGVLKVIRLLNDPWSPLVIETGRANS